MRAEYSCLNCNSCESIIHLSVKLCCFCCYRPVKPLPGTVYCSNVMTGPAYLPLLRLLLPGRARDPRARLKNFESNVCFFLESALLLFPPFDFMTSSRKQLASRRGAVLWRSIAEVTRRRFAPE